MYSYLGPNTELQGLSVRPGMPSLISIYVEQRLKLVISSWILRRLGHKHQCLDAFPKREEGERERALSASCSKLRVSREPRMTVVATAITTLLAMPCNTPPASSSSSSSSSSSCSCKRGSKKHAAGSCGAAETPSVGAHTLSQGVHLGLQSPAVSPSHP